MSGEGLSQCLDLVIGSGPAAGYTAGYTARAMLEPLMFAGYMSGGQLIMTVISKIFRDTGDWRAGDDDATTGTSRTFRTQGTR